MLDVQLYIVGKRFSVAEARQHLADVLDLAEKGAEVEIERRGVRYIVKADKPVARAGRRRRAPRVAIADTAVEAGAWTWNLEADGLRFQDTRRRKP